MRKPYDRETFTVNKNISFLCDTLDDRSGYNHRASLFVGGQEVDRASKHYEGRTWESYTYQSVMEKLVANTSRLTPYQRKLCKKFLKYGRQDKSMKAVATVAMLGDIFGKTKAESNDWKERMLKAGLGDQVDMPEDWDALTEEEKERRLNGAINALR